MTDKLTIKINYRGGIISPGEFYNVLVAAESAGVQDVSFGLRQQLLIELPAESFPLLAFELERLNVIFQTDVHEYPNIISSYPAEEVFIHNTWLSEGVYKDIFDEINYHPKLKINIADRNQSFTPILTGNINWLASSAHHFWHLFIRFPKTNTIYEWDQLVYTNDVSRMSRDIEQVILDYPHEFYDNRSANGDLLFKKINAEEYITQKAGKHAVLPLFTLPYYEGLNRYNDKYWLGIYRRDQLFKIEFLMELCLVCLKTKIGQICTTPWKSIIVKSIEEKDKALWNRLLEKHTINMRHAANELNFQVEDSCSEGLALKNYLVKGLNCDDIRTFGLCIGIKTRRKSEVFSSILIRRRAVISFLGLEIFYLYDILCARDFNPNARTGFVFSKNNPKFVLREQLRSAIVAFYADCNSRNAALKSDDRQRRTIKSNITEYIYQCKDCLSVYDDKVGDPENGIAAGTPFELLPADYQCYLCEGSKDNFTRLERNTLATGINYKEY